MTKNVQIHLLQLSLYATLEVDICYCNLQGYATTDDGERQLIERFVCYKM